MLGLLPTELHQYSVGDISRGLIAARQPIVSQASIPLPGLGDAIPVRSARAAMIIALKALGMRPGSRVGVPLYCCPVIFKAIKAADCRIRFLDIDPETFCLSTRDLYAKSSECDAVVAVHMFGNVCDMPEVIEIMDARPVIEDCAQSLGSKLNGQATGSFGDISFFSFRSGKYLSAGEGGALYSKNPNLRAHLSELIAALPAPSQAEELKHVLLIFIRSKLRSRPLWGLVGTRIWAVYNKKTEFVDKSQIIVGRVFLSDLATVGRRILHLDSMISSQRAHADYYEHKLRLETGMLCHERPRAYYNRFMYPITFPSSRIRDLIAVYLKNKGIDSSKPYEDAIAGAAKHYGYEGDCPLAERSLKRALIIPSFYKLKPKEIEHIVQSMNQGYLKARSLVASS